jgi:uncharacterized membrane protein
VLVIAGGSRTAATRPSPLNKVELNRASPSIRGVLLGLVAIMGISFALHVVPQAFAIWIDPAWSMLALMIGDAILAAVLARRRGPLAAAALIAALLALTITLRQQALAAAPSIAVNLTLAALFGATLRAGSTPLLVRIAAANHPQSDLSPAFVLYLRHLTLAWVAFFVAMAAMSLLLALTGPFVVWSLFVNVLTWPLIGMMVLGEWIYRRAFRRDLPTRTPPEILAATCAYFWRNGANAARVPAGSE